MSIENFFGTIAFITSIIGLFPQIIKTLQTRSSDDISMIMLINFLICSLAWIVYGSYSHTLFVLLSNVLGLMSCLLLIGLKLYFDRQPNQRAMQ